jgi:pyrroline-5-carboxylate reductase
MKVAFVGGGVMGEVILSAVLDKGLASPQDVSVSDVSEARRHYLEQKYAVAALGDNRQVVGRGDIVVMAIKPQNLVEVMAELDGQIKSAQLVISIIAGARIATLSNGLNHRRIVRVMPNTPARIGEGMAVWTATDEVTEQQRGQVGAILSAMGKELYVDDEKYIDMATAVSGSGPAYVFLFVEALVEAAESIGLPQDMARKLVLQTLIGSGHFLEKSDKEPAELRRMVTSPGGTTAEALAQFEKGQFTELVKRAVEAAYKRARELGS